VVEFEVNISGRVGKFALVYYKAYVYNTRKRDILEKIV
jgi:hypothetical protein